MKSYDYDIRRWTRGAIDCYMRGCICQDCPIYELIFRHYPRGCQMKYAVIATVRKFRNTWQYGKKNWRNNKGIKQ